MKLKLKLNSIQSKIEDRFNDKEELVSAINRCKECYHREILVTSITPEVAEKICSLIRYWNLVDANDGVTAETRIPIKIIIDSHGGSLEAAFTIIDIIRISRTPVYTFNIGACYKEALFVFLAGLKRFSLPRASFLLSKNVATFLEDAQQSNYDKFLEKQNNELKQLILEKTNMTENEYDRRTTYWMDADTAYTNKFCNEIIRNIGDIF
jgi:ATP-dependent protease ClpP protease subunit